ncbi:MAG TPA: YfcE family phosphodiesterase [Bacteroidetes bacterium]|nr:YfcE family phosphodiesterase [Bacteroidota bacterium]
MKKILLLSDTHGYLDDRIIEHCSDADEVWHAGDWGEGVAQQLEKNFVVRGVFGNIDGKYIREKYPEHLRFKAEGLDVFITHIGGYPGNYDFRVREEIKNHPPQLFICGHSHILKIMYDDKLKLLHINPGAAGKHGFHIMRTMVRFQIENGMVKNPEVIELGKRNSIS